MISMFWIVHCSFVYLFLWKEGMWIICIRSKWAIQTGAAVRYCMWRKKPKQTKLTSLQWFFFLLHFSQMSCKYFGTAFVNTLEVLQRADKWKDYKCMCISQMNHACQPVHRNKESQVKAEKFLWAFWLWEDLWGFALITIKYFKLVS